MTLYDVKSRESCRKPALKPYQLPRAAFITTDLYPFISLALLYKMLRGEGEKVSMQISSQGVMLHQTVLAPVNPSPPAHAVGKSSIPIALEP